MHHHQLKANIFRTFETGRNGAKLISNYVVVIFRKLETPMHRTAHSEVLAYLLLPL